MSQRRGSIRAKGNGFEVRYTLDGKQRSHYVTGTLKEAQRWLTEQERLIDQRRAVGPTRMTVGGLLEMWLAQVGNAKRPSWRRTSGLAARRWQRTALTAVKLQVVTAIEVMRARDQLLAVSAPNTVVRDLSVLNQAMRWAIKMRLLPAGCNPVEDVDRPHVEPHAVEPLTLEQAAALLVALEAEDRTETNLLAVGLCLGVRSHSELGGVRLRDLDLEHGTLVLGQVLREDSVNGAWKSSLGPAGGHKSTPRTAALPTPALPFLRRQAEWVLRQHELHGLGWNPDRLLFANNYGRPVPHATLRVVFKRRLAAAGVPDCRIHDLRHTVASLMLADGASIKDVQAILGHATHQQTMGTYAHLYKGSEGRALEHAWGGLSGQAREAAR